MRKEISMGIMCLVIITTVVALSMPGCGGGSGGGSTGAGAGDGSVVASSTGATGSPATQSDVSQIKSIISQNALEVFDIDAAQSGDADVAKSGDKMDLNSPRVAFAPHQRWYRYYTNDDLNVETTTNGDTAKSIITCHKTGFFYVWPTPGSQFVTKNLDDTLKSTAQLQKVDGKWTLTAISPIVITPTTGKPSITISKVSIYDKSTLVATITDPTKLIPVDQIPAFSTNSQAKIEISAVSNASSSYSPSMFVFVQYSRRAIEPIRRLIAYDDGGPNSGDAITGDNNYTMIFNSGMRSEIWKRCGTECLTAASILSSDDDYQSVVWIFPYYNPFLLKLKLLLQLFTIVYRYYGCVGFDCFF